MLLPLTTARANKLALGFLVITRHPLQLESCSNPLRMRQVFLVLLKKTFFDLGEGFAWERLAKWGGLCFLTKFDGPWTLIQWAEILDRTFCGN